MVGDIAARGKGATADRRYLINRVSGCKLVCIQNSKLGVIYRKTLGDCLGNATRTPVIAATLPAKLIAGSVLLPRKYNVKE
jgi:hypothetical protein